MTSKSFVSTAFFAVALALTTTAAALAQLASSGQTAKPEPIAEGFGAGAYRPQPGIADPIALKRIQPGYTDQALQARIQGEVELEFVVLPTGLVGDARVVRSLDQTNGLDGEAVKAAKQWLFAPGRLNGVPVPVIVRMTYEFSLYGAPVRQDPFEIKPPMRTWTPNEEFLQGVSRLGQPNVTMPVLESSVEPRYTRAALHAKTPGTMTVDMVVGADGRVIRSRIARTIDPANGLDWMALQAAMQWRFKPGEVNGQPAPVLVTVTMEFRLH